MYKNTRREAADSAAAVRHLLYHRSKMPVRQTCGILEVEKESAALREHNCTHFPPLLPLTNMGGHLLPGEQQRVRFYVILANQSLVYWPHSIALKVIRVHNFFFFFLVTRHQIRL